MSEIKRSGDVEDACIGRMGDWNVYDCRINVLAIIIFSSTYEEHLE